MSTETVPVKTLPTPIPSRAERSIDTNERWRQCLEAWGKPSLIRPEPFPSFGMPTFADRDGMREEGDEVDLIRHSEQKVQWVDDAKDVGECTHPFPNPLDPLVPKVIRTRKEVNPPIGYDGRPGKPRTIERYNCRQWLIPPPGLAVDEDYGPAYPKGSSTPYSDTDTHPYLRDRKATAIALTSTANYLLEQLIGELRTLTEHPIDFSTMGGRDAIWVGCTEEQSVEVRKHLRFILPKYLVRMAMAEWPTHWLVNDVGIPIDLARKPESLRLPHEKHRHLYSMGFKHNSFMICEGNAPSYSVKLPNSVTDSYAMLEQHLLQIVETEQEKRGI